ncbi:hypothetical protein MnTg03_00368 [bacterium MnTg03]|nr:hypothetical protein MnTg03_00368 [bacterium MnTg03]
MVFINFREEAEIPSAAVCQDLLIGIVNKTDG